MKSSALENNTDILRQKIVEATRAHKASWIQLGQYLFSVHKDKLYKTWGFLTFEAYCIKELGIKQTMASKLIRSYDFLEKEEPRVAAIATGEVEGIEAKSIPNYESVNLLRLAKQNKNFTAQDVSDIREAVIEEAREPKEVKATFKKILEQRQPEDTKEEREARRQSKIRRVIGLIRSSVADLNSEDMLPDFLVKQVDALILKLEDQLA